MASVRERPRKDGSICYAVLFHIDGKQSSVPFDDKRAAEAFRLDVEVHGPRRAIEMRDHVAAYRRIATRGNQTDLTVAQWVRRHIDQLTGCRQYTIDTYNRYLRQDIEPTIGSIPLAKLTEEDIAAWVKRMESTPRTKTKRVLAASTIGKIHGYLSGALNVAVQRKLIPHNPAEGRRLSRVTGDDGKGEKDTRFLSHDEFSRLLASTTEHWRPLVSFLLASGARWGEVVALKPEDVDRERSTVWIGRAENYSSKGYEIRDTKTKRSKRRIDVAASVLKQLDYSHADRLFTNTVGNPVRYHSFLPQVWDRAVAKAKLDPRPTPHALRHTCASWMLNAGVPMVTVSRHLGHESIKITADIYGHVDRASAAAAAEVMGRLLG